MKAELLALAERVEGLTGPCRRTDGLIAIAIDPERQTIVGAEPGRFPQKAIWGPVSSLRDMAENSPDPRDIADYLTAPRYTGSLDAARSLVPEGYEWQADSDGKALVANITWFDAEAATPELALTAAALRAKAEMAND